MSHKTLADLPDDVLLLVFSSLDSARELRALALSCRRLNHLVAGEGWRVFVKSRFPSLSVPIPQRTGQYTWRQAAESLTWQSRCWDKRSLTFYTLDLFPVPDPGRQRGRREAPFQPVVDAHFDLETQEELLVCGAGEDVVARYRLRGGASGSETTEVVCRAQGKDLGFTAGYDDVRAISVIKGSQSSRSDRTLLVGRDNGNLALLSADPARFGELLVQFKPGTTIEDPDTDEESKPAETQDTINSLDVLHRGSKSLIAAATKSSVLLYDVPENDVSEVSPSTAYNLREEVFEVSGTQLCGATWMEGGDVLALALKGCKDPLRYLTVTPWGFTHHTAVKNKALEAQFDIGYGNLCPNSLQPVYLQAGAKTGASLLLSAWRDGTCRLQDLRTPSAFDAIYQDNVDPWADMEALMTYGAERFVGGGMNGATIKIFDFRWTKGYYHTSGLSCLNRSPYSHPSQPFLRRPDKAVVGRDRCNHVLGLPCHWHEFSRHIYYRPNASIFLRGLMSPTRSNGNGIWSLAKGSDMSPNFYIGVSGGVIEAKLELWNGIGTNEYSSDVEPAPGRPYLGLMMETGDGLMYKHNDRAIRIPRMWPPRPGIDEESAVERLPSELKNHHRLDRRFQLARDYLLD